MVNAAQAREGFHPATWLWGWLAGVVLLERLPLPFLVALVAVLLLLAHRRAMQRLQLLLGRARWLLLSLLVLFAFFTPGQLAPEPFARAGLTLEGAQGACEHVGRLLAILASLALMHERLGTAGLVSGLYWLLAPVGLDLRRRIVVRLLLMLETAENDRLSWRECLQPAATSAPAPLSSMTLELAPFRRADGFVVVGLAGFVLWLTVLA